eukprot:1488874-Karenia_brevis.AAC.1
MFAVPLPIASDQTMRASWMLMYVVCQPYHLPITSIKQCELVECSSTMQMACLWGVCRALANRIGSNHEGSWMLFDDANGVSVRCLPCSCQCHGVKPVELVGALLHCLLHLCTCQSHQ